MKTISYLVLLAGLTLGVQSAWADVETGKALSLHEATGRAAQGVFPSRGGPIDE